MSSKRGSTFHGNVKDGQTKKGRRFKDLLDAFIKKPFSHMQDSQSALRVLSQQPECTAIMLLLNKQKWKLGMFFADYVNYCVIGASKEKYEHPAFVPINLRESDNPYHHFKHGCIMGNFSAMIGCLNREAVQCANSWKRRNPTLVGIDDKMPDYVKNIPSINLGDPAYSQVLDNIDFLQKKSLRLRGDTVPRTAGALKAKQIVDITSQLYDKLFGHLPGAQHGFNGIDIKLIDPKNLTYFCVWFWIVFVTVRGSGALWALTVWCARLDGYDTGSIMVFPNGKDVNNNNASDKKKKIYVQKNRKGLASALKLMRKLCPSFFNNNEKGYKYRDCFWLMWLARTTYDKDSNKWTGYKRMRLGKNQFDAIVRAVAALFGINFLGTVYSMRYSIICANMARNNSGNNNNNNNSNNNNNNDDNKSFDNNNETKYNEMPPFIAETAPNTPIPPSYPPSIASSSYPPSIASSSYPPSIASSYPQSIASSSTTNNSNNKPPIPLPNIINNNNKPPLDAV
eukprot:45529_1